MNTHSTVGVLLLGLLFTVQAIAQTSPAATLDTLYKAGADANQAEFTALLTEDAVFMGVNGNARLQGKALRDFVRDSFASGDAWDYRSSQRVIQLSADGAVAWFDESLEQAQLGSGRGTGVLTKTGGVWKIAQYSLTIPLPEAIVAPEAATPAVSEGPQKPQCRKIRHKTNKQASC